MAKLIFPSWSSVRKTPSVAHVSDLSRHRLSSLTLSLSDNSLIEVKVKVYDFR